MICHECLEKSFYRLKMLTDSLNERFGEEILQDIKTARNFKFAEELEDDEMERRHNEEWGHLRIQYRGRRKWNTYYDEKDEKKIWGKKYSFEEAIKVYGERSWKIWECQSFISPAAARYILLYTEFMDGARNGRHIENNIRFHPLPILSLQNIAQESLINHCVTINSDEDEIEEKKDYEDRDTNDLFVTLGLIFASPGGQSLYIHKVNPTVAWTIGEYDGKEFIVFK
jgi:hypothetical protein